MNTKHLTSGFKPGDPFTIPQRVILHESLSSLAERPEWVTHIQNMRDGSLFWGHYFSVRTFEPGGKVDATAIVEAYTAALKDYVTRCEVLGVDPMPSPGVAATPAGVARPDQLGRFVRDAVANTAVLNGEELC